MSGKAGEPQVCEEGFSGSKEEREGRGEGSWRCGWRRGWEDEEEEGGKREQNEVAIVGELRVELINTKAHNQI